jgi:PAS domain S-box-containing protein
MTLARPISQPLSETGEEPFGIGEVFISRTDSRGVIQAGNEVFRRVSGFDWAKLIGAAHRVVRHPDTPRAVFWILWNTIQKQEPIAAFVKNRSASGGWYWVLAVVLPVEEGYLSGRIKPTGPLFSQVRGIYEDLLTAERDGLAPDKSAEKLLERLKLLGFDSYREFMSVALDQELTARDAALGRGNSAQARAMAAIRTGLASTQREQTELLLEFDSLQSIPTNMRIIASRLEPSGGPISAISDNYKFASTEISRRLEAFAGAEANLCRTMGQIVGEALFLAGVARLMAEILRQFASENHDATPIDKGRELAILRALDESYAARSHAAIIRAEQVAGDLNQASGEIRRMMLGLDTIRVMGRVESGRLGASGVGLASTIDQLDTRHAQITTRLQLLMDLSAGIKAAVNANLRQSAA